MVVSYLQKYIESKLLWEKELLGYNDSENPAWSRGHSPRPETVESTVAPVTSCKPYFTLPRIRARCHCATLVQSYSLVMWKKLQGSRMCR